MESLINTIYELNARWWLRILFAIILLIVIWILYGVPSTITESAFLFETSYVLAFSLLAPSIIIETLRKKSRWYSFGIRPDRFMIRDVVFGFLIVAVSIFIIFSVSMLLGKEINYLGIPEIAPFIIFSSFVFFGAAAEELIYRGIIFQAFLSRFNPVIIILISSIAFSVAHIMNPNINTLALINIFLANILMSTMYVRTLSLWLPITFHFCWNLGQHVFLGSSISGYDFDFFRVRILDLNFYGNVNGYDWLIGGRFGIEEGFITTLILLIFIPIVLKYAKNSPYITARIFKRDIAESEILSMIQTKRKKTINE